MAAAVDEQPCQTDRYSQDAPEHDGAERVVDDPVVAGDGRAERIVNRRNPPQKLF
jgi:hypothetical protein